jgi:hypothetical protein
VTHEVELELAAFRPCSGRGRDRAAMYHDGSLHFQDHFDTRRLADRIEERLIRSTIGDDERAFIERLDMFFLATADAAGRPQCSYKGGDPGFVRVLDEHTLAFPSFDGNGCTCHSATCASIPTSACCSSTSGLGDRRGYE